MLFTQNLPGYSFNNFFLRVKKVTMVFIHELSAPCCVIYHAIYTYVIEGILSTTFFFRFKIMMVFAPNLAGLQYVSYRATYKVLIICMFQQLLSTRSKVTTVFVHNLSGMCCVLQCYLHIT